MRFGGPDLPYPLKSGHVSQYLGAVEKMPVRNDVSNQYFRSIFITTLADQVFDKRQRRKNGIVEATLLV